MAKTDIASLLALAAALGNRPAVGLGHQAAQQPAWPTPFPPGRACARAVVKRTSVFAERLVNNACT
jgi:hypothetical protein